MELANKTICTGCGACAMACPQKAIGYYDDEEGFPSPYINEEKCIECGICNLVCPAIHPPTLHLIREAYAAQLLDHRALMDSTSGGVFTAFSREIICQGGIIYGCIWDDQYRAVVTKAKNEEEIRNMRGSKYVWSWAGDSFPEIKTILDTGKPVLFTGLACQVAGLKAYLRRDYDNLYTMDFLCSGAPSPLAFQSWLRTLSDDPLPSELNLKFRDKKPYGCGVHITYNGQKKRIAKKGEHISNPYYYAFFSHLLDRRSCYQCPYGTDQRVSDISMGDYWGVVNYHREMDIKSGVSALMINSEKGARLLERVKDSLELKPTEKENIGKANNLRCNGQKRNRLIPEHRDAFFNELRLNGWKSAEKRFLHDTKRLKMMVKAHTPKKMLTIAKKIFKRPKEV